MRYEQLLLLLLLSYVAGFVHAASRKKGLKRYDALVKAVRKNDVKGIQRALKKGANVNMVQAAEWRQGKTALMWAAKDCNRKVRKQTTNGANTSMEANDVNSLLFL